MNDYIPFASRILSVKKHTDIEYTLYYVAVATELGIRYNASTGVLIWMN